jgi:KISS1 receptor
MNISNIKNVDLNDDSLTYVEEDINEKYNLHIIVPVIWSFIIVGGVVGNGLIIYIILRRRLYKNSCPNCYIINVAIADLCFTIICVPFTMSAYIYKEWIFGEFMCSFENLVSKKNILIITTTILVYFYILFLFKLMFTSVQVSCLTLTAMTIDRYTAILYPLRSLNFRTTKLAFATNIFIWIGN